MDGVDIIFYKSSCALPLALHACLPLVVIELLAKHVFFVIVLHDCLDNLELKSVADIKSINISVLVPEHFVVQGRYDVCCPMMSAWDLHKAWPESEFKVNGPPVISPTTIYDIHAGIAI